MGFTTVQARDGKEALERLATLRPCVILLDLMMPRMDGLEFLRVTASDVAITTIPVVVVTAYSDYAAKLTNRVREVLKKPVDPDTMVHIVRRLCASEAHAPRPS